MMKPGLKPFFRFFLLALLTGMSPAVEAQSGHRAGSKPAAKSVKVAVPSHETEDDKDTRLDGSKLFTGDTEIIGEGDYSVTLSYFLSIASKSYDEKGALLPLDGTRRSELYIASFTTGIAKNVDLTVLTSVSRINDLLGQQGTSDFALGLGPAQGAGLTNFALTGHWRIFRDDDTGRSLSISGGPALQEQLQRVDQDYKLSGSFLSWQQSAVLRQDFDQFSANLEIFYAFPIQTDANSFQQFGANLALGWEATSWLTPVVELNYAQVVPLHDPPAESLGVTLGLVVKPSETISLSLGAQKTLGGRNIESFTTYTLGASVQF